MPPRKNPITTSTGVTKPWLSAADRRAAQTAELATQQSRLKQEAAERRLARERAGVPPPRPRAAARRSTSR
jgi:hypothetical protein